MEALGILVEGLDPDASHSAIGHPILHCFLAQLHVASSSTPVPSNCLHGSQLLQNASFDPDPVLAERLAWWRTVAL
eukprot:5403557-Amphidinium_carterae.1